MNDKHERLQKAGEALYMATRWISTDLLLEEQSRLWIEFRDALGLAPGTATRQGVGDE